MRVFFDSGLYLSYLMYLPKVRLVTLRFLNNNCMPFTNKCSFREEKWLFKYSILQIAFLLSLLFSCEKENLFEEKSIPSVNHFRMASGPNLVPVTDGVWSHEALACVPPAHNCSKGSRLPISLRDAVQNGEFASYILTLDGIEWLNSLHDQIKTDILTNKVLVATFPDTEGYFFFVYPHASGPLEGPDYSVLIP